MRRYRERLCRAGRARSSRRSRRSCPAFARAKTETVTWGANVEAFSPDAAQRATSRRELGIPEGAVAVLFSGSFRPWHGVHVLRGGGARGCASARDLFFLLVGGAGRAAGRGLSRPPPGHACPTRGCPRSWPPATSASPPTTRRACASSRSASTGRRSRSSSTWRRGLPTRHHPAPAARPRSCARARKGCTSREGDPGGPGARPSSGSPTTRHCAGGWARSARARVVERYSWARHCEQLERCCSGSRREDRRW